jgi:anti-sigma regulatory factor (Ser/Thr protein kinase)
VTEGIAADRTGSVLLSVAMPSGSVSGMGDGIELPAAPTSPATARRWATDRLESWGEADLVDTVTLLVTELVTNVLLHAHTPCELRIEKGERLRVEVVDGSGRVPEQRRLDGEITGSGNGLLLLGALSDDHGVMIDPTGKRVWFELEWPHPPTDGADRDDRRDKDENEDGDSAESAGAA